jgi:hypothetical protein
LARPFPDSRLTIAIQADHALSKWSSSYMEGMQPYKDPRAPLQLAGWMRQAGFKEVESTLLTLPMCGWSSNTRDHTTGLLNVDNVQNLLQSLALYPVTHLKGMPMDEFDDLVDRARKEATDPSLKVSLYATIGLPKVLLT